MNKSLVSNMKNNATVLVTGCVLLCLALNYTFPLHRNNMKRSSLFNSEYINNSWHWDDFIHHKSIVERSKKMANDIENVFKKFKTSAQDIGRNIYHDCSSKRENKLNEEDLRQYEQLVMMKKYPYLDLKDLENKFSWMPNKNIRQSLRFEPESNLHSETNFLEPDEELNVEIINRGLSGFNIPPKMGTSVVENKVKTNTEKNNEDKSVLELSGRIAKKSSKRAILADLEKNIIEYEIKNNKFLD